MNESDGSKHHRKHSLAQHEQAVARSDKVTELNTNERIDHARDCKRDDRKERHRGVAAHGDAHIRAKATAMRDEAHKTTHPQHDEEKVNEQGVRSIIMITARRRVTLHTERNSQQHREEERPHLASPRARSKSHNGHQSSQRGRDEPDLRRRDLSHSHPHKLRIENLDDGSAG